jgi:PKD repeat protein
VDLGADTAICEGQTLTLDAANAGSDYLWSDASTNQTLDVTDSGDYSVIVTNTLGCSGTDTVHVTVDPLPSASSIVVTDNGDGTYTFSAEDPSNVAGYNWDFGDGSPTSSGQLPTHTYAPGSDTFTVTLIITNECGSDTLTTTIETTGINRVNIDKNQLKLYPNPTRDVITIQNESAYKMEAVTVYNVLGQVVMQHITTDAHQYKMDVSGLTSGLYTVRIETNAGFVMRKFEVLK